MIFYFILRWRWDPLYDPESDGLEGDERLVAGPRDLRRREEEAVSPSVLELERERVLDAEFVRPVVGAPRRQVCEVKHAKKYDGVAYEIKP